MERPLRTLKGHRRSRDTGVQVVLEAIYEASLHPVTWTQALAVVADWLDAPAAFLQIGPGGPATAAIVAASGLEPTGLLAYRASDPMHEPLASAIRDHLGEVVCDGDGFRPGELDASEFGRLLLEPAGLAHVMGASLACDVAFFAALWLLRPAGRPFTADQTARLHKLMPHLQRAVAIERRIAEAEQQVAATSAALDRIALGAIVVDPDGRPLLINRLAEHILDQRDGLLAGPLGLVGINPAATIALRQAIRETITGAIRDGHTTSIGLRLERQAACPLDVIVVSLKAAAKASQPHSAIVFVADSERAHITPDWLLRDLYGMTAAEARLALAIVQGASLTDAASALGIARNTAHCQLASIFHKTGTSTQAELVRLLHRGVVAIRPYEDSSEQRSIPPEPGR